MQCYKSGGCGVYEMYSCQDCPASQPAYNKSRSSIATQRLMAVWSYDKPPFFLAAEIVETRDDGYIKAKGFEGMWHKPVVILPYDEGRATELKQLATDYDRKHKELLDSVKQEAQRIIFMEPF